MNPLRRKIASQALDYVTPVVGSLLLLILLGASPTTGRGAVAAGVTVSGTVSLATRADTSGAVVWLEPVATAEESVQEVVVLDQRGLDFQPHVLTLRVGGTVEFRNSDTVLHNIFAPGLGGEAFDLGTWPAGQTRSRRFDRPGVTVLLCNVHPEMEAFVVVVPSRWYADVGADGAFTIPDVPAGEYLLVGWHERGVTSKVEIRVTGERDVTRNVRIRGRRAG